MPPADAIEPPVTKGGASASWGDRLRRMAPAFVGTLLVVGQAVWLRHAVLQPSQALVLLVVLSAIGFATNRFARAASLRSIVFGAAVGLATASTVVLIMLIAAPGAPDDLAAAYSWLYAAIVVGGVGIILALIEVVLVRTQRLAHLRWSLVGACLGLMEGTLALASVAATFLSV